MTNIITFKNIEMDVIDHDGQRWLDAVQIGSTLGLANPRKATRKIFSRHEAEFTPDMTAVIKLPTPGGPQMTRIFSPRGAWLLGFFARTKVAAEFRKWVLDVLDNKQTISSPTDSNMVTVPTEEYIDLLKMKIDHVRLTVVKNTCVPLTEEQKQEIARLYDQGLSIAEIHHKIGRHKSTIRSFLKRRSYGHA